MVNTHIPVSIFKLYAQVLLDAKRDRPTRIVNTASDLYMLRVITGSSILLPGHDNLEGSYVKRVGSFNADRH